MALLAVTMPTFESDLASDEARWLVDYYYAIQDFRIQTDGQVRSIKHCGDTYTVETADGKVEKIWEFNLRFKSDSSKLGPAPGKPVVVGAGMQGDRASIVFASPKEISGTIKQSCP